MPIDEGMAFTLAHFSDPHLPPLPKPRLKEIAGKRVLGYLNWTRNRHKYYRREVLDALVRDLQAQTPDHIAVTGDLITGGYRYATKVADILAKLTATHGVIGLPFDPRGPR